MSDFEYLTNEQLAEVTAWIKENGYESFTEWGNDSDYEYRAASAIHDEGWFTDEGYPIGAIEIAAFHAMEAAKEFDAAQRAKKPEFGHQFRNGAIVIRYTHIQDGENGWKPNGVVLCVRPKARIGGKDEFVTWTAYQDPDGTWGCEVGHYSLDFFQAVEDYKKRGGK